MYQHSHQKTGVFIPRWSLAILPMLISVALPAVWPLLLGRLGLWLGTAPVEAAVRALVTALVADMFSNAHAFAADFKPLLVFKGASFRYILQLLV